MNRSLAARTSQARWPLRSLLIVWTVGLLLTARPPQIAPHWRQAETQSIALNFLMEPNLLFPRINWGGSGPGYVESELQLYPGAIAVLMWAFGKTEAAGQWLSLLLTMGAAWLLFRAVERRYGDTAGLVAAAALLGSRNAILLGTAVMPDSVALFCYVGCAERFLHYVDTDERRSLVLSSLYLCLAALIKPIALSGAVVQAAMVLASGGERRLKDSRLWFAWGSVGLVVGAFLLHGVRLHLEYGNTFGVISGGDSKFPDFAHLSNVHCLWATFKVSLEWGLGYLGALALMVLLVRRRLGWIEAGFVVAGGLSIVASLRYASQRWLGAHYHIYLLVAYAWLLGALTRDLQDHLRPVRAKVLLGTVSVLLVGLFLRHWRDHREFLAVANVDPVLDLGAAVRARAAPGALIVAQTDEWDYDTEWKRSDNYQDPRLFYASGTRGWVLPGNVSSATRIAEFADKGAQFYATAVQPPVVIGEWLSSHARLVWQRGHSSIWQLSSAGR